jgi:hypothetical protein
MQARGGKRTSRWGIRLRRASAIGIILLVFAAAVLWSGQPQRAAVERIANRMLAADVEIEDVALLGRVRMGTLRIYDGPGERARGTYTLDVRGLDLDYSVLAANSRPFPEASIDALVIRLDGTNPQDTNYDFATRLLAGSQAPAGEESSERNVIPSTLAIGTVAVSLEQPGYGFGIRGLGLSMDAEDDAVDVHVEGDSVAGWFGFGDNPRQISIERGVIDLQLQHAQQEVAVRRLRANLPGLLELDASGTWRSGDGASALSAELDAFRIQGAGVSGFLEAVSPLPVRFETADLTGTQLAVALTGTQMAFGPSVLRGGVQALAVGTPGHELFQGNVAVTGALSDATGHAVIALGRGQRIAADWSSGPGVTTLSLVLDAWTIEDLRDALPRDFRPALDGIAGLAGVGGSCTLAWEPPRYTVNAEVAPVFTGSRAGQESFQLALTAQGRTSVEGDEEPLVDGTCALRLGEGEVNVAGVYRSPDSYSGTTDLTAVDPWLFLGSVFGMDPLLDLPDARVSGTVALRSAEGLVGDMGLRIEGLGADAAGVVELAGTYAAGSSGGQPASVDGRLVFPDADGTGTATFAVEAQASTGGGGLVTFSDLDPFGVACLLNLMTATEGQGAQVNGTLAIEVKEGLVSFAPDLTVASLAVGGWALPADTTFSVEGEADWDGSAQQIAVPELTARLGEDGELRVSEGTWNRRNGSAEGLVACRVDLDYAAAALGLSGVYGEWSVEAPVRYQAGIVKGTVALTGNGAGFGGFSTPYGTPVTATGGVSYDLAAGQSTVETLEVTWPPATRLTSPAVSIGLDPLTVNGAFTLTSDLAPLVDMGLLDSVEGGGEATGIVTSSDGATEMAFDLEATAESLVVADALAALTGSALRGAGRLNAEGLEARGEVQAAEAAVAGAVLRELAVPVHIKGWSLAADGFEAELFDGGIKGSVSVELAEEGFPGRLTAEIVAVDLATFCEEFEPPGTRLTGSAGGRLMIEWNADGLAALEVDLACEEGFTMNRELIEQLLLKQLLGDAAGTKRLGKIREKVIGEAPQRPFDRAALTLRKEGDMLRGEVKLPSEQLNLTVDLKIDPRNIFKALELRQKSQLDQIGGITTEPAGS